MCGFTPPLTTRNVPEFHRRNVGDEALSFGRPGTVLAALASGFLPAPTEGRSSTRGNGVVTEHLDGAAGENWNTWKSR